MPAQPGEVSLLTLFADVHYIFSPPHVDPPHHRFDKTSYVYLFQNPMQGRGRLEIANHAGTPKQDAFIGYLDTVRVERSHKHPTLFTLVADGSPAQNGSANSTPQQDLSQWHLPAADQRGEGRYTYKIHTVDIYFWTVEDSSMFLDSLKRVLREHQLRILDAPQSQSGVVPSPRQSTMSPVVQKLEQAAISTPYHGRDSMSTTHSFPGPPTAPTPSSAPVSPPPPVEAPAQFAPMAYNPAAPAAPEPIAHRDPTPPPPDAEGGTGLAAAATHDHSSQAFSAPHLQHQGSFPQQSGHGQQPYMPGPQQHQASHGFSSPLQQGAHSFSPPPPPQQHGTPSFSPPPSAPPAQVSSSSFPPPPPQSFAAPPQALQQQHQSVYGNSGYPSQQYANYPGSPGHPPVQSPGFPQAPANKPSLTPGQPSTPGYAPAPSPGLPPGGYSQYSYGSTQPQSQSSDLYGVHQQAYTPTEAEYGSHAHKPSQSGAAGGKPSRFDTGAKKFEKGVSGFLKKLDKKF